MNLPNNFHNNLKNLRLSINLTQKELGERLGISKQVISYYEKGKRYPDLCNLIKISNFFNCSIDSLIFTDTNIKIENLNDLSNFKLDSDFSPKIINDLLEINKKNKKAIKSVNNILTFLENVESYNNSMLSNLKDLTYSKEIDSNDTLINLKNQHKTEIAEETSPVISLDEYKSSKNSIDVDFYRNNDVKIFTSYYSKRNNKNLVAIPFCGDISCGALKYMSEHLSEYFYLNSNDLRYDDSEYFVLQVDGESMNKLYKNGDFLLVKKTSCFDSFNKPYVFYFDDSATLKYIELSEEILRLIPHSTKNYEPKILTFEELQYMQHGVVGTIEGVLNFIED